MNQINYLKTRCRTGKDLGVQGEELLERLGATVKRCISNQKFRFGCGGEVVVRCKDEKAKSRLTQQQPPENVICSGKSVTMVLNPLFSGGSPDRGWGGGGVTKYFSNKICKKIGPELCKVLL